MNKEELLKQKEIHEKRKIELMEEFKTIIDCIIYIDFQLIRIDKNI